jgi:hypothetical protein
MLAGETRTISITTIASATEPTAVSLAVTMPTGTLDPSPPTPTITANADTTWTLSALYHFAAAGAYQALWSYTTADGEVRREGVVYFASWTDVEGAIGCLLPQVSQVPAGCSLDGFLAAATGVLISRFHCLQHGGYGALTGLDKVWFDQALVLLLGARLRPLLPKTATGEVVEWTTSETSERFQPQMASKAGAIEEQWAQTAALLLGRISCIQAMYAGMAAAFSPFVVNGPTRHSQAQGCPETLFSDVARLLSDSWGTIYGAYAWGYSPYASGGQVTSLEVG